MNNLDRAGTILLVILLSLGLVVPKLPGTVHALGLFLALFLVVRRRNGFEKGDFLLLAPLALLALDDMLMAALAGVSDNGFEQFERDLRLLFGAGLVYLALRCRIDEVWVRAGLVVGAVGACIVALVQVGWVPAVGDRASGASIAIVFGHLLVPFLLANILLAIPARGSWRKFHLLAVLAVTYGIVLSQTRGAALGIILGFAVVLFAVLLGRMKLGATRGAIVGLAGVVAAGILSPGLVLACLLNSEAVENVRAGTGTFAASHASGELRCLGTREFLDWYLEQSSIYDTNRISIHVVSVPPALRDEEYEATCAADYAIEAKSITNNRSGFFYSPFRNLQPGSAGHGVAMMQGVGTIGVIHELDSRRGINAARFELATSRDYFAGPEKEDYRSLYIFQPRESALVIPVLLHDEEYAFKSLVEESEKVRSVMWAATLESFADAPFIGKGVGAYQGVAREMAAVGEIPWLVTQFDHPHSDSFTMLFERGALGVILYFVLLVAPMLWFWDRYRQSGGVGPLGGLATMGAFAGSGLTETMLNHSITMTFLPGMLAAWVVLSTTRNNASR